MLVAAAALAALLYAPSTSAADGSSGDETCPERAEAANEDPKQLTILGVRCFKSERYARAYSLYRRAFELEESDLLRAAIGRSLHELGLLGVAKSYYQEFLDDNRSGDDVDKIRNRLDELQSELVRAATVHLSSFPPNSRVFVQLQNGDWVELGVTPTRVQLRPREYTFRYRKDRYRDRTVVRHVDAGDEPVRVEGSLYPVESAFDVYGHQLKRTGSYLGLGSIPVLTAGGILFGLAADKFEEAEDYTFQANYVPAKQNRMIEQAHIYQRWAIGLTAGGSAMLLTAGILFFRGRAVQQQSPDATDETASVRPLIAPRFVGLRGRF